MTVAAAIFDIGNVLLPFDYMRAANALVRKSKTGAIPDRKQIEQLIHALEAGKLDSPTFISSVKSAFDVSCTDDEFLEIWRDIFEANTAMMNVMEHLADRMPVFLISNISDIHWQHIRGRYPTLQRAKDALLSFETGLLKPDTDVFVLAEKRFQTPPNRTVYFDDIEENCKAAETAGYQAFRYLASEHERALEWLETLGIRSDQLHAKHT